MERIVTIVESKVKKALKIYGAQNDLSTQDIVTEAIMDYLQKVNYKLDT